MVVIIVSNFLKLFLGLYVYFYGNPCLRGILLAIVLDELSTVNKSRTPHKSVYRSMGMITFYVSCVLCEFVLKMTIKNKPCKRRFTLGTAVK